MVNVWAVSFPALGGSFAVSFPGGGCRLVPERGWHVLHDLSVVRLRRAASCKFVWLISNTGRNGRRTGCPNSVVVSAV